VWRDSFIRVWLIHGCNMTGDMCEVNRSCVGQCASCRFDCYIWCRMNHS